MAVKAYYQWLLYSLVSNHSRRNPSNVGDYFKIPASFLSALCPLFALSRDFLLDCFLP